MTEKNELSGFFALPPAERLILCLLAVDMGRMNMGNLFFCLDNLPGRSFPMPDKKNLGPMCNRLVELGLAERNSAGVRCSVTVRPAIILHCLREKQYAALYRTVTKVRPASPRITYSLRKEDWLAQIRDLMAVTYLGEGMDKFDVACRRMGSSFIYLDDSHPFDYLFPAQYIKELRHYIHQDVYVFLLTTQVSRSADRLRPEDTDYFFALREQVFARANPEPFMVSVLLNDALLRGEAQTIEQILHGSGYLDPQLTMLYQGAYALLRGDLPGALEHYAGIQIPKKKINSIGTLNFFGLPLCLYRLALVLSGRAESRELAASIWKPPRKVGWDSLPPDMLWHALLDKERGRKQQEPYLVRRLLVSEDQDEEDRGSLSRLLTDLPLLWLEDDDGDMQEIMEDNFSTEQERALASSYRWLAQLATELLCRRYGQDTKANRALCATLQQQSGYASVADLAQVREDWQVKLDSLQLLALGRNQRAGAKNVQGSDNRLIWRFFPANSHNEVRLEPRLQSLNKKGVWSRGRPVALKTLQKEAASLSYLTPQDQQIASTVRVSTANYGWGYGSRTEYSIDMAKTLPLLVGHPAIFLEESETPAELVIAKPSLRIQKKKNNIILSLHPQSGGKKYLVEREGGSRFVLYQFDKKHQEIEEIIGSACTLPAAASEQARQTADALARLITVQSDIGGGTEARQIAADHTPHLLLTPMGQGLRLELMVKPLGDGGAMLYPGKGAVTVLSEIAGERVQTTRDLQQETSRAKALLSGCPSLQQGDEGCWLWEWPDPADSLEMLLELSSLEKEQAVIEWPKGQSYQVRAESGAERLALRIKQDTDWFQVNGTLQLPDGQLLELQQLLNALPGAVGRFVRLDDGSFLALTKAFRKRLEDLAAYSRTTAKGVHFSPLASFALEGLFDQAGQCQGDTAWKKHLARLETPEPAQVPSTLQAELRGYQEEGFRWLARLAGWGVGACLADDMGLGKTIQALATLLQLAPEGPILVVAPLSVISNWQEEAARFAPTLQVQRFGPGDRQQVLDNLAPFDLLLCSYGLLQVEAERLAKVAWRAVVLDEAQAIKNRQTKRAQAAMALQAPFRLITTGTPVENHLGELWTLFHFLNPGLLGGIKQFEERFGAVAAGPENREQRDRLRRLIRPFILRRLKNEVLQELPPRTEITLRVSMSEEERSLYEAQRLLAIEALEQEEGGADHVKILAQIMRLRRLCCNPALVLPPGSPEIASSKLKVFGDTVTELLENKHKALVFSQFTGHLALIREFLDARKISYQYLDGQTTAKQRQERIAAFQAGTSDLFLISLKAGGFGLNLTAADFVLHMDPWWNPAVEDQASDRAHRIGQQRPVTVYRLVMEDTIEEKIVALHAKKRDLADSLLEGSDVSGRMSANELLQLLRQTEETP